MSAIDRFRLAGVMGHPVLHSRSPRLHDYWLRQHGLAGAYVPLDIRPERLGGALRALPALGFSGVNLTIPHKVAALGLVDATDESARAVGAVNCVVVRPDGSLLGANYDGFGFLESVRESAPGWRADAGPIVVLGAGGAARAVLVALKGAGAGEIRLVNRTAGRAGDLAGEIGPPAAAVAWAERGDALAGAAMLVNATSLGMTGQPPLDLPLATLPREALVVDIVYAPRRTALLAAAGARGNPLVFGLGMLLHQARPAFRDWFGIMPAVTPDLVALIEATI